MPASFLELQTNLKAAGFDPGAIDGLWGPQTVTALLAAVAGRQVNARISAVGGALSIRLPQYQVSTPLRVLHFVAQAVHETEGFVFMYEQGGPTYFEKYDGRADLGNSEAGDGYRYRGRGIFQLTGRANYAAMGPRVARELVEQPDMAADPATAAWIACLFWDGHGLNSFADADNIDRVTRAINGGVNGLEARKALLRRGKTFWGLT